MHLQLCHLLSYYPKILLKEHWMSYLRLDVKHVVIVVCITYCSLFLIFRECATNKHGPTKLFITHTVFCILLETEKPKVVSKQLVFGFFSNCGFISPRKTMDLENISGSENNLGWDGTLNLHVKGHLNNGCWLYVGFQLHIEWKDTTNKLAPAHQTIALLGIICCFIVTKVQSDICVVCFCLRAVMVPKHNECLLRNKHKNTTKIM